MQRITGRGDSQNHDQARPGNAAGRARMRRRDSNLSLKKQIARARRRTVNRRDSGDRRDRTRPAAQTAVPVLRPAADPRPSQRAPG